MELKPITLKKNRSIDIKVNGENYNNQTIEIHHTESGDLHVTAYTHGMNANIRKAHNNDKGYNRVDACDGNKVISVALLTNPIDKK